MSAAAETPPPTPSSVPPPALPPVRHEVVDPADKEAVAWLCELLRAGQADLYGQDEADLGLLPTLARTWMRRGEQWKVPAPGTNRKCSVSATVDLSEGWLWWFTHPKRSAVQFGVTLCACTKRSQARGRLAVLLVDNAPSHQPGKTGILLEHGTPDEIAGALRTLISDPPLRTRLGEAAAAHARGVFDPQSNARAIEQVYDSLLRTGRGAAENGPAPAAVA